MLGASQRYSRFELVSLLWALLAFISRIFWLQAVSAAASARSETKRWRCWAACLPFGVFVAANPAGVRCGEFQLGHDQSASRTISGNVVGARDTRAPLQRCANFGMRLGNPKEKSRARRFAGRGHGAFLPV